MSINNSRIRRMALIFSALLSCSFILVKEREVLPMPSFVKEKPGFHLIKNRKTWWLADSSGKQFFSLGVCCVNTGESFQEYSKMNPGYAAWRFYPSASAWADDTISRLKSWGFTTIGGWSDNSNLSQSNKMDMPFTVVLHLGAISGAPWRNMWDPRVISDIDDSARRQILPIRNDPRLLGYYIDNELGWWNAELFRMTLEQPASSEQRRRLIKILETVYNHDWKKLLHDFDPVYAHSFASLQKNGSLYLRPGGNGIYSERLFLKMTARRYYSLMKRIIRKYDTKSLILGDRYQSFYYPEVASAAGMYVDVVSTNLNPGWTDGTIPHFFLKTLYEESRRPITIGEFYMTATENSSGDKNSSDGFPVVQTQVERALGFKTTADSLARKPYVVGADWFQYYDEPQNGRADGENYNMGLVDIDNRPYTQITQAAAKLFPNNIHSMGEPRIVNALDGIPPAPTQPLGNHTPMSGLLNWNRGRGFVPPSSKSAVADLYLCWDSKALYAGVFVMDISEGSYYQKGIVPEEDRMEWMINPDDGTTLRARMGSGRKSIAYNSGLQIYDLSGLDDLVRGKYAVELPARLFGRKRFAAGDHIRLTSSLFTQGRAYKVEWHGNFILSN